MTSRWVARPDGSLSRDRGETGGSTPMEQPLATRNRSQSSVGAIRPLRTVEEEEAGGGCQDQPGVSALKGPGRTTDHTLTLV